MEAKDKIIVALDTSDAQRAEYLVESLLPYVKIFKVGLELCTAIGKPQAVKLVLSLGGEVFLDTKLNDTPNVIAQASKNISKLGVKMFTIHAAAGFEAIQAAVLNKGQSRILAVTVPTSMSPYDCMKTFRDSVVNVTLKFTRLAKDCGVDGIICSAQEIPFIKANEKFEGLIKVIPGIRPKWAASDDQKRVVTPKEAIEKGGDYLVIGRPILKPPPQIGNHVNAIKLITEEIQEILNN